ncbi:hypothetical protein BHE74_00012422 [Ensete ventricosum]|nr:hypothetical protein BHE74_00012422 [Ensete ventricosum]RZR93160.1 hypothetical protein BHM03_00021603 [Ensete ventricosum]
MQWFGTTYMAKLVMRQNHVHEQCKEPKAPLGQLVGTRYTLAHSNICTGEVTPTVIQLMCVNPNSSSPLARSLGQEQTPKVASTVRQAPTKDEVTPTMVPPFLE